MKHSIVTRSIMAAASMMGLAAMAEVPMNSLPHPQRRPTARLAGMTSGSNQSRSQIYKGTMMVVSPRHEIAAWNAEVDEAKRLRNQRRAYHKH